VAIIGIIAAIAIPNLLKSRQAANEAAAISACRTVGTAQATFQSTQGLGKDFAADLGRLATEASVDSVLGSGVKSGYSFSTAGVASTATVPSYFDTQSVPQSTGTFGTGNRYFYSNETFVIWQATDSAITSAPAPPATRVPTTPSGLQALQ
jgi:type II secretory pathway pseudopilin PulG